MDSLVITFREGIEAALVVGIMLAYVQKTGRVGLRRWILAGTVSAVLFSVAVALALGLSGVASDNPMVEGVLYSVAAVAVLSMVVWMRRNSKNVRGQVESKMGAIVDETKSSRRIGLSLLLLSFFMVAREGVETVLFISAGVLGGANATSVTVGGIAGLALAVTYGVLFARGSARIDLRLFFNLTSIVLVLLAIKLAGGAIHEFEEVGLISMSETMAHFFDAFGGSVLVDWLFLAALVVPLVAPYAQRKLRGHSPATNGA
jgi:FTR1 family protein